MENNFSANNHFELSLSRYGPTGHTAFSLHHQHRHSYSFFRQLYSSRFAPIYKNLKRAKEREMSSCSINNNNMPSEQVCYIPCNFCNIILAVSVPCSSLFDIVTVRCGHCTNLWPVNMAAALQSLSWQDLQRQSFPSQDQNKLELGSSSSKCNKFSILSNTATNEERMINRVPQKRQRVPSAYNQFIKEEIQRIKTNNPDISHREAFSTAAKNWAHFPHIHFGLMLESNNQSGINEVADHHTMTKAALLSKRQ